ncbi:GMC family oxidoreductase [Paenibacillus doosanensis]|uniref:Gluconate 2-dehydrogenase flavoprotein n=1 Tax=Paenibacillus konkukensis TaxID=2020716 RepID=A0ABY4RVY5_9BACL|nr:MULTISPECIES: GMC family oxidoreductase [Paenibacillus]MCS7458937.1 GMC family oxidoreductase [Paenibacillus doosanensis]UQZ86535.1 Gluconate 2-dehydrogenase flavoprotein precursor [Paenibacillus konkukensis]
MATTLPKVPVVIVGLGWTGGVIAAELTKAGHKVVALERGKARKTEDYYMVHDELRYARRYGLMQDLSKETVTFRNTEKLTALPMRSYGSFLLGEGLGGAGIHWNGQYFRFLPYDFQIYSKTVERYGAKKIPEGMTIQDWGITYDELEPYFDKFEKMAGISGEPEQNPMVGKRSNPFPTPAMKKTPSFTMFEEATKKLGYHPYMMPSGNLSTQYTNPDGIARAACQYCAFCERFGCEYGAKADPVVTVIPVAQQTGNLEIRTESNVTKILNDGKKATGVVYVNTITGEEFEQPADVVILTSYVFNNVRLLLNSKLGKPYDPKSGTGVVGRNYAYQVNGASSVGFYDDQEFNLYAGAGALGMEIDDFNGDNFDHGSLNFIHGAGIRISQAGNRPIDNNSTPKGTPAWGKDFKQASIKYANRVLSVSGQGSNMPWRHHYLDLDPTYKDVYGMPLLRITYDFEDQDRELVKFIASKADEIMKEMKPSKQQTNAELKNYNIIPYQSTHNTGGVVMGSDPSTSVVNTYLQMWDADNVFVIGASAFAHNSGYNPTATVGALSYRAAEGILKYLKTPGSLV